MSTSKSYTENFYLCVKGSRILHAGDENSPSLQKFKKETAKKKK